MSDTEDIWGDRDDSQETHEEPAAESQDQETKQEEPETVDGGQEDKPAAFSKPADPYGGEAEAVMVMERAQKKKEEKMAEDLAEFTEMRKAEKQQEEDAILALKAKREQRLKERAEDEKRWAEQRQQEEARRKAEEEERRRKKQEEEDRRKAERDRKRREAEKRVLPKKPNFKIVKREDGTEVEELTRKNVQRASAMTQASASVSASADTQEDENKPKQKSKEELEKEKRAVLEQRIKPLAVDGADKAKLLETAKQLHEHLLTLASNQYDLEQIFKRQQYDMIELTERARQMSKQKSRRAVSSVQIDESFDRLADRFSHAPPPVLLASKFDINLDRRSWKEKLECFNKDDFDIRIKVCSEWGDDFPYH